MPMARIDAEGSNDAEWLESTPMARIDADGSIDAE